MADQYEYENIRYDGEEINERPGSPSRPYPLVVERRRADGDRRFALRPQERQYRDALQVMTTTPEIESRLDYATAGMIVAVFSSWLAASALQTRAAALVIDTMIFVVGAAVWGLLIGIMIGIGILPLGTFSVLLYLLVGAVFLLLVILLIDFLLLSAGVWSNRRVRVTQARKVKSSRR
jgi:hypothetical protein